MALLLLFDKMMSIYFLKSEVTHNDHPVKTQQKKSLPKQQHLQFLQQVLLPLHFFPFGFSIRMSQFSEHACTRVNWPAQLPPYVPSIRHHPSRSRNLVSKETSLRIRTGLKNIHQNHTIQLSTSINQSSRFLFYTTLIDYYVSSFLTK